MAKLKESPAQASHVDVPTKLRRHLVRDRSGRVGPGPAADGVPRKPSLAAQYIRVSTDDQRCSAQEQRAVMAKYASDRGIEIVETYVDEGRSGLTVDRRAGLQTLLAEVLSGAAPFSTILVADVSRWGRFQDPDEAAHYEFLCREAGVTVIYCADFFPDGTFGVIAKQLKRVMAGEYSRELSTRVRAGRRARAVRGRALGGPAIYGFRRQIVNADGSPGRVLEFGERKGRHDLEVRSVWGPPEERAVIERIFQLYVHEGAGKTGIARTLNREGIRWRDGSLWDAHRVRALLRHELIVGFQAYEKSQHDLGKVTGVCHRSRWRYVRVLDPLIDVDLFVAAQERSAGPKRESAWTTDEMLRDLRLLVSRRRPTKAVIQKTAGMASGDLYRRRFGSIEEAYAQAGYRYSHHRRGLNANGTLWDRDQIISALETLHQRHGRISIALIVAAPELPCPTRIRQMFGSIPAAYEAAGVPWGRHGTTRGVPARLRTGTASGRAHTA